MRPLEKPAVNRILGVPVHCVSMDDTLTHIAHYMNASRLHQVATVNPEFIMTAQRDPAFRQALQDADLCLPDGVGVLLAARWQRRPLPERVPGSELIYRLAARAAMEGWPLFLLGAAPGVGDEAAVRLQARYPGLLIAGVCAGSPALADNRSLVEKINASQAAMLWVAYGAPGQDKWIARNRRQLPAVRVAIGVGGSLDFVAGRAQRAPERIQQLGLEWLYRLGKEPWRWRRMLALPQFALRVLLSGRSTPA